MRARNAFCYHRSINSRARLNKRDLTGGIIALYCFMELDMAKKIDAGDVVRLKSGGPDMTVALIGQDGQDSIATCVWFNTDEDTQFRGDFEVVTLEFQEE